MENSNEKDILSWIEKTKNFCKDPRVNSYGEWIDRKDLENLKKKNNFSWFKFVYPSLIIIIIISFVFISRAGWIAPKTEVYVNNTITNPKNDVTVNTPEIKPTVNINFNNTVNIPNEININVRNSS